MKITIAKTAGFCMGVRRAVEIALDQANARGGEDNITAVVLVAEPT